MKLTLVLLLAENILPVSLPVACGVFAVIGAIIGSFLNVVIHRLPREQSITLPASACPSCGKAIKPYDNIPIVSFLILSGRCRSCGAPISARYPIVEALTALLFALVALRSGISYALPFDLAFVAAVIALLFIDAEHMILPNAITYPGIVFALGARILIPYLTGTPHFDDMNSLMNGPLEGHPLWMVSIAGGLIGAAAGGGSLWLMGFLWEKLRGVEAMGLGDVKMMFMVGIYLGWRLTILTIFIAVLVGSLAGIAIMLRRGSRSLQLMLPFGIFLGAGAILSLLFGVGVVSWYASQFRY
jgi:leader peptidase (prepilin peptidase) / N-methyltransferase